MKQKVIGIFALGYENVQLVLRDGTGGNVFFYPEKTIARIKVGADYQQWKDVLSCLLHEAMEMSLARDIARYFPAEDVSNDSGAYLFICDHAKFSNCCAKAAEFLAESEEPLKKAWKKWHKKKK